MASRGRFLFVMPAEFCDLLRRTKDELDLDVILYRGPSTPFEQWDGRNETLTAATRVYFANAPAILEEARPDSFRPGELGWVQLDVPRVDGRELFGVELAAKSDWFVAAQREIKESPVALKLFDRLLRRWRKQFTFGVSATNVKYGGETLYPTIGYSPGAAAWYRKGGALRKTAVANIAYGIPDPETPPQARGPSRKEQ